MQMISVIHNLIFPIFYFLSYGYVSVRVMVRDRSTEKHRSRQFLNAVEWEPVRLGSSIQKHAGSRKKKLGKKIFVQIFFEKFSNIFSSIFFFFFHYIFILHKIIWHVPEKNFIDIRQKKKIWSYFSLFRMYQIDHISKTKNQRIFLLFFPFYSAPSAWSTMSEWFCIIYKKWVIKTEGRGRGESAYP